MNKESKEYLRVREEVAERLPRLWCQECHHFNDCKYMGDGHCEEQLVYADYVLSIEGIAILSDEQVLPKVI